MKKEIKHEAINRRAIRAISRKILRSPSLSIAEIFAEQSITNRTNDQLSNFIKVPFEVADTVLYEISEDFKLDRLA